MANNKHNERPTTRQNTLSASRHVEDNSTKTEVNKPMSKDQTLGGILFLLCVVIAIFYVVTLFYPDWMLNIGWAKDTDAVRFWIIGLPVFIAFIAVIGIGAWIGWTMATTPPPKPIGDLELEEADEMKTMEKPEEEKEE